MFWSISVIAVFLCSVFCAGILIPQILLIAFRKSLFDMPDERKIHHSAVPRLGGMAFAPVVLFSASLLLGVTLAMGDMAYLNQLLLQIKPVAFLICAVIMLYVVGLADDLVGVKYRAKFVVQILCAIMFIAIMLTQIPSVQTMKRFAPRFWSSARILVRPCTAMLLTNLKESLMLTDPTLRTS